MKQLDIQSILNKEYLSIGDLLNTLKKDEGTTDNIDFILRIRQAFLDDNMSAVLVDTLLWTKLTNPETLIDSKTDMSLFLIACHIGSVTWFNRLLDTADIHDADKIGYDAPFYAVVGGSLIIVKSLFDKGFDFNKTYKNKCNLLIESASSKNPSIFDWLLEKNTDSDIIKLVFIDFILTHNNFEITNKLISKGIDLTSCQIELRDKTSLNPLEATLHKKHFESAKAILAEEQLIPPIEDDIATLLRGLSTGIESNALERDQIIIKHYAELRITMSLQKDKSALTEFVNKSEDAVMIKKVFAIANINPALDVSVTDFEEAVQPYIYEAMFI